MAKLVLNNTWQALPVASGTIQNNGTVPIEISEIQNDDSGQVLYPEESFAFNIQLYARTSWKGKEAEVRVVPFQDSSAGTGGGGGSSASPYVLPQARDNVLGGVTTGMYVSEVTQNGNDLVITKGDGSSTAVQVAGNIKRATDDDVLSIF